MNIKLIASFLIVVLLSACASNTPAPVETRTSGQTATSTLSASSASSVSAEPAGPRPGYYIVKKGDTLYSISLENGHDYRDVASWNGIANPSLIRIGQELRVVPPGAVLPAPATGSATGTAPVNGDMTGTQPVMLPRIESRPLDQSAPSAAEPPKADAAVLREPRGGRVPYSEKAWADLQALPLPPAMAQSGPRAASAPLAASEPKAVTPPAVPAAVPATVAKPADDKAEWGWPSNGKVIGAFNDSSNKGLDFGGAIGDPVFAAASGKVIYAGSDLRGYGNLVIIKHGSQYTTVYAHNKEILVKEQQQVQKGQKIAVMGDSDADRPKLHFEMRMPGGKPVDPNKLLPTR